MIIYLVRRICIKIEHSVIFLDYLKNKISDRFFFVVGETSYGLCCADDIAALHLKAELIVRIGNSCLTKNKQLPVYFLFENKQISNIDKVKEDLKNLNSNLVVYRLVLTHRCFMSLNT